MKRRYIHHDGFARYTLYSEEVAANGHTCDWCGQVNGRGNLYEYVIEPDSVGAREQRIRGRFCSASCMRSYHYS